MRRIIIRIVSLFLTGIFQSSFFNLIGVGRSGVKPNFLFLIIVFYALFLGSYEGAITGFWAGLVQDIISGRVIGVYAIIGLTAGLLIGLLKGRIYRENTIINAFLVFILTMIYEFIVAVCLGINLWERGNFFYCFKNIILIEAIYNTIMSLLVFRIMNRIEKQEVDYSG